MSTYDPWIPDQWNDPIEREIATLEGYLRGFLSEPYRLPSLEELVNEMAHLQAQADLAPSANLRSSRLSEVAERGALAAYRVIVDADPPVADVSIDDLFGRIAAAARERPGGASVATVSAADLSALATTGKLERLIEIAASALVASAS